MEIWQLVLLAVVGLIAGILNVIAGGGSLLTLPVMLFMGLDGPVANGTNRIAICAQNLAAITAFKRKGFSDFQLSLTLSLATIPGAVAGALAATEVRGVLFNRILAVVMVAILVHMMLQGKRRKKTKSLRENPSLTLRQSVLGHLCMLGIGFYGGFIQAGVGFVLMASLHNVMSLDLVRVNMHKVFVVGAFAFVALIVFAVDGKVLWIPGIALALGTTAGGWIGSHLTVTRGEGFIRKVLVVTLAVMAVRLFFMK